MTLEDQIAALREKRSRAMEKFNAQIDAYVQIDVDGEVFELAHEPWMNRVPLSSTICITFEVEE